MGPRSPERRRRLVKSHLRDARSGFPARTTVAAGQVSPSGLAPTVAQLHRPWRTIQRRTTAWAEYRKSRK